MSIEASLATDQDRRLLVIASKCCLEAKGFDWYDSQFLWRLQVAKEFLRIVAPDRLPEFEAAFDALRTDPDYRLQLLDEVFDAETFGQVIDTVHALPYVALEHYESGSFGRSLLRNHPLFTQLQSALTGRVSELVGEPVSPSYNFLSLYRGVGRCDPHLDDPIAKRTLDICVEQSVEWPIYFSQVVDWPSGGGPSASPTIEALRSDPALRFDSVVLSPNRGAIFSGSSQWHFREAMKARKTDFCHLLFFHYLPSGAEALADPTNWANYFNIPELEALRTAEALVIYKRDPLAVDRPTKEWRDSSGSSPGWN